MGEAVAAAEARLFVGRAAELEALSAALADCRQAPVVVYLNGPPGTGKSALLRQFRRRASQRGGVPLLLDGAALSPTPTGILGALAQALDCIETNGSPSAARVVAEANRRAQGGALALLIDTYEKLQSSDAWFRAQVLYGLGPGVLVVLAGHLPPVQLWGFDPAWLATVRMLPLGDLPRAEALQYLRGCGVDDPALRAEAAAVSGGRPLLLKLLAGIALSRGHPAALRPRSGPRGLVERLLEEWTHGAHPTELPEVLTAAALVRAFDRDLLSAMVGPAAVAGAWDALMALPVVVPAGHRHALHETLREHLAATAARSRPWVVRRWRRRAIDGYLQAGPVGPEREEIARLAAHALWHPWLHPAAEVEQGWRLERGAHAADAPQLASGLDVFLQHLGWTAGEVAPARAALDRYLKVWPEGFTLLRDGEGVTGRAERTPRSPHAPGVAARPAPLGVRPPLPVTPRPPGTGILGWVCTVPLSRTTRAALLADPAIGPYLQAQSAETLAAWQDRSLVFCQLGSADPEGEVHHVLVREVLGDFAPFDRVLIAAPGPRVEAFLVRLGFQPDPDFTGTMGGGRHQARIFRLDLAGGRYGDWLRGHLAPGDSGLQPAQWVDAAQEALDALADPARLGGTAVAAAYRRMFRARLEAEALRAWVTDALTEIGRADKDLSRVLAAYHLERLGSHEVVAQRLGLSQRTYYRRRRQALEALGRVLFA